MGNLTIVCLSIFLYLNTACHIRDFIRSLELLHERWLISLIFPSTRPSLRTYLDTLRPLEKSGTAEDSPLSRTTSASPRAPTRPDCLPCVRADNIQSILFSNFLPLCVSRVPSLVQRATYLAGFVLYTSASSASHKVAPVA